MFSRKHQTLSRLSSVLSSSPVQFPLGCPVMSVSRAVTPRTHRQLCSYSLTELASRWQRGAGSSEAVGGSRHSLEDEEDLNTTSHPASLWGLRASWGSLRGQTRQYTVPPAGRRTCRHRGRQPRDSPGHSPPRRGPPPSPRCPHWWRTTAGRCHCPGPCTSRNSRHRTGRGRCRAGHGCPPSYTSLGREMLVTSLWPLTSLTARLETLEALRTPPRHIRRSAAPLQLRAGALEAAAALVQRVLTTRATRGGWRALRDTWWVQTYSYCTVCQRAFYPAVMCEENYQNYDAKTTKLTFEWEKHENIFMYFLLDFPGRKDVFVFMCPHLSLQIIR